MFYELLDSAEKTKIETSLFSHGLPPLQKPNQGETIKVNLKPTNGRISVNLTPLPRIRVTMKKSKSTSKPITVHMGEHQNSNALYYTKSLCILSHYPFFSVFKSFLTELYRLTLSTSNIPIERYICNFLMEVPLPPPGRIDVSLTIGTRELIIARPSINQFPLKDVPFEQLFLGVSVDDILYLFNAILQEQQILMVSRHYSHLGYTLEALTSFLYPFSWLHVYIPLLPKSCIQFVNAPVPFIMGAHASSLEHIKVPSTVILVDLDSKKIKNKPHLANLPEKDSMKLRKTLKEILGKYEFKTLNDNDLAVPLPPSSLDSHIDQNTSEFPTLEIRAAFFRFFVSLFQNYKNYLIKHTLSSRVDDPNYAFNIAEFVKDNYHCKDFLSIFLQTQGWQRFVVDNVEGTCQNDIRLFDESIIEKLNRSKLRIVKEETPFIKSKEYKITKRILINPPSQEGLTKEVVYKYTMFPRLDPNLYQTAMIPETLVKKDEVSDPRTIDSWKTILTTLSVLSHPQAIESLSKTYETHQGEKFAGTTLFIETRNLDILYAFSKFHIDTTDECGDCHHILSDPEIRQGWSSSSNDYRTTCPKCKYKFVARFTIKIDGADDEGDKREYLSYPILTKEITNLMKKEVGADSNLFKNHPVVFWNIILHLRELKIPLNFLLPQVDWSVLVDVVKSKMKNNWNCQMEGTPRKTLPRLPSRTGSGESPMFLHIATPNLYEKKNSFEEKKLTSPRLQEIKEDTFTLKKHNSTTGKPLPEVPRQGESKHKGTHSMDFSSIPIGLEAPRDFDRRGSAETKQPIKKDEKKSLFSTFWKSLK